MRPSSKRQLARPMRTEGVLVGRETFGDFLRVRIRANPQPLRLHELSTEDYPCNTEVLVRCNTMDVASGQNVACQFTEKFYFLDSTPAGVYDRDGKEWRGLSRHSLFSRTRYADDCAKQRL